MFELEFVELFITIIGYGSMSYRDKNPEEAEAVLAKARTSKRMQAFVILLMFLFERDLNIITIEILFC